LNGSWLPPDVVRSSARSGDTGAPTGGEKTHWQGSNGRTKAARRLGKIHARVAAVRKALLHQVSSDLAHGYAAVVIEDLNAAGTVRNRKLARHIADASFGELRRQLEYKCAWYGTQLVVADRWYPSSKTCSGCGVVKTDLTLSDRVYNCGECGLVWTGT